MLVPDSLVTSPTVKLVGVNAKEESIASRTSSNITTPGLPRILASAASSRSDMLGKMGPLVVSGRHCCQMRCRADDIGGGATIMAARGIILGTCHHRVAACLQQLPPSPPAAGSIRAHCDLQLAAVTQHPAAADAARCSSLARR